MSDKINSVQYILNNYPADDQKVQIKNKGRPTPNLVISVVQVSKNKSCTRTFNKNTYDKYEWMCGCPVTNKLYCFMCLLFPEEKTAWMSKGITDLTHLADRARRHDESVGHIKACMNFAVLGAVGVQQRLSSAYLQNRLKHNEKVDKNLHILKRLITCIKFSGAFELALRGRDERMSSDKPGIYAGLINFAAELDSTLAAHLNEASVFKDSFKTIQNELLDAMFKVYRKELIGEIKSARFVAIEVDETMDSSNQQHLLIIIRYMQNKDLRERFWSFVKPDGHTAEELTKVLMAELESILNVSNDRNKLIAQSYNGGSVMCGKNNSVQSIIRETFPHAYLIHCYAHQFNIVMEQATLLNKRLRVFFANLQGFANFFLRSPKRTAALNDIAKQRLPNGIPTPWDLKNRTVNTLYECMDLFQLCLETIIDGTRVDSNTINEACGLLNYLQSLEFCYWLKVFHFIMPHVEVFFNQTQACGVDGVQLQMALEQFEQQIVRVKSVTHNIEIKIENEEEPPLKKRACSVERSLIAQEVCDNILEQIKDRFNFKGYISAASLFDSKKFKLYQRVFPQQYFDDTVASYTMLNSDKLKAELTAIYMWQDMSAVEGVLPLFVFIAENNLRNVLSETFNLLNIICTTPMFTTESERCFSTLNRIKTFLQNTMMEDRLNALAALSVEKEFIHSISDFDNAVLEIFIKKKNRKDFLYI